MPHTSPWCGPGRCWRYTCHHAIMALSGLGTSHTDTEIAAQHVPTKIPGAPGLDWRSRVGGATGETAGRRKRIIRRDGASRSRGERAPRFSVPPLGPAPRCHSTSFLPRPASETARASEATSEITEPRPSEGTWLAHGNPGTGISSPAQNPLPRLSLPTVTLPDTLPPPPPAGPRHPCADRCALPVAGAPPPPGPHPTNSLWSPLPGW